MFCAKCGAAEDRYFGFLNEKAYCRRCLIFRGDQAVKKAICGCGDFVIPYQLTLEQQKCADDILTSINAKRSILVHAVCGAGKTEIIYPLVKECINSKKYIGLAIPRREVVIELTNRFRQHFPFCSVEAVYGGKTDVLTADFVILTTHQLFRYQNYFDILIIDEVDAFPYLGNDVLHKFAKDAAQQFVYLSATPPNELLLKVKENQIDFTSLYRRHHRFLLPEPRLYQLPRLMAFIIAIKLLKKYLAQKKQVFVFAPTIALARKYHQVMRMFISSCVLVHSQATHKEKAIQLFREQKIAVLVTTSILERGVTVKGLQVIVLEANHCLFTTNTLIQIAGRVGRKSNDPTGSVVFFGKSNEQINTAIKEIKNANRLLPDLL